MVNSGAIATTSLVPGATLEAKWKFIHEGLSRFAGRTLPLNDEVYASAIGNQLPQPEHRPPAAKLRPDLHGPGRGGRPVHQAVLAERQRQGSGGDGRDLGRRRRESDHQGARGGRRQSATTRWRSWRPPGLYETSGDWLYDIGLPGKSGIGGGIVTVSPGKGGLGTFAPPLDKAGNSVKGQLVAKFLSQRLGMDLFVSQPEV